MGGVMQWLREKILPIGKWRVFAIILAGLVTFSADDFAYLFLPEEWITHNTQILGWVQLIAYLVVRAMAVWLFVSFVWWVCKNAEQWAKKIRRRKRGSNRMGRVMQLLHGIILSIGKWRVFAIILAGLVTFSADNFARRFLPKEWITHNMQILGWVQFIAYLVVCAVAVWLLVSFVWWVCKNAKRWTKRVMKWLHKKNLLNLRSWGNAFALAIILVILVALGAANFAHLFVPDKLIIHKMWVLEELQFLAYLAGVGFALWKWRRIKAWSDVIFGKVNSGTKWSNSEMILAGLAVMGVIGFTPLLLPNEWIDPDASVVERLQFAAYLIGGGFLVWQLRISNRRASAAEKNAQLVEKGNITERFKNAIEFLADKSESVQIGGIYTLYHVAKEAEEYKEAVLKILLAHLRKITAREENPINRVVMAIWDALFVPRGKKPLFEEVDLSFMNLKNIGQIGQGDAPIMYYYNLSTINAKANLNITDAYFGTAHLDKAVLWYATCEGTVFDDASCIGTNFFAVQKFQRARFINTDLTKANFLASSITAEQLLKARTLYQATLPPDVHKEILRRKPELLDPPADSPDEEK